jgi:Zn ribbon nucleic-acid-binding protein
VVREHQVLVCPDCYPAAVAGLTRCSRCDSVRLVRQLDQVECLECGLTRDAGAEPAAQPSRGADSGLAAEVARALERILGN